MTNNYDKNIAAIKELYPDFAELIQSAPTVDWVETVKADNGATNLLVRDAEDRIVLAYNEADPAGNPNLKDMVVAHNEKATIMFGIGAGHGLAELLRIREPHHTVIVVEPVMAMLRIALTEHDFSEAIRDRGFFLCPGKAEVEYTLALLEGHRAIDGWNYLTDRVAMLRAEYWAVIDASMAALNQSIGNISTVESHGLEMAMNDISTLPYLIRKRGVKDLVGLHQGKPAIIVATGPSLERNIHMLKDVCEKGTAIIVAVAQALRPLLSYGVRPDFICTVDFGEVNMTHLDGLMDQDVPLICISKAYKPLVAAYKGPKFVSVSGNGDAPEDSLYGMMNRRGALMQGGSVLHFAFGLGAAMKCDPLILVGADLAYPDEQVSHFGQADSMGKLQVVDGNIVWHVHDPRSPKLNKAPVVMGQARYVPGYFGGEVLTNAGLQSFITTMESYAQQAKAAGVTVIDATEGGAHIRHTRRMYLADALEKFCNDPIDKGVIDPLLTDAPDADDLVAKVIPLLDAEIRRLSLVKMWSENAIRHAKKMRKIWDSASLLFHAGENKRYTLQTQAEAKKVQPLAYVLLGALRKMWSREYSLTKEQEANWLNDSRVREIMIRRNLVIVEAAHDAAEKMLPAYKEAKELLTRSLEDPSVLAPTGEVRPPSLDDSETYFEQGNFARPMLEAQRILASTPPEGISEEQAQAIQAMDRALGMKLEKVTRSTNIQLKEREMGRHKIPLYLDLMEDSKELGRMATDESAKAAMEKIEEAIALIPDREEARWGRATLLTATGKHEEADKEYAWLADKNPDNLRYVFEWGQVLTKIKGREWEGVAMIQQAINENPKKYAQYQKELDEYKEGLKNEDGQRVD